MKDKSTGWKIPLLFCASILLIGALVYLFIPKTPGLPDLPPDLLQTASQIKIDMDLPENKIWKQNIIDSASGFNPQSEKDKKLYALFSRAMQESNLQAAASALIHIKGATLRLRAVDELFVQTLTSCPLLPWGVFAINAERANPQAEAMASKLSQKWQACKNIH